MASNNSMDVQTANEVIANDPAPQVSVPGKTSTTLLRGIQDPDSKEWFTNAIVREMTGADEEEMSSFDTRNNVSYSEYMSHLLKRAVVSIGNTNVKEQPLAIDDLIIGDRDILFMAVIRATYGRYREFEVNCRECSKSNNVTVDLDTDFPVEDTEHDLHKDMKVTLKNGSVIYLRYPRGSDSQYVAKKAKTTAEQNTIMLARCVVLDEVKQPFELEAWARELSLADRNKIVKTLLSAQPGPRMEEVKTQCAHCNANIVLALDWVALLFG